MKKITLVLLFLLVFSDFSFSQATMIVEAPLDNTTTQVRAPNGLATYAYMRACALVMQSELTNIPLNSTLTTFGFTLATAPSLMVTIPVTGNFTLFLENTPNTTYLKGTNWATILTGMQTVYASVMTIPIASTTSSVIVTLSGAPFVYTGGGLYVAYDWYSAGPYSAATNPATFFADGGANLNPGCASANSAASAPVTLATTAFRPSFLFGFANPFTNDVQIVGLESPGKIAGVLNTPHNVKAMVRNSSSGPLSNITVSLNVTGANAFANTQTISSLAAGSSTLVSFAAYNPLVPGPQTISVTVPTDQNNVNNLSTYSQNINCNVWSQNPASGSFTSNAVGFGAGSGILATPFVNPVTSTITGMRGAFSNNAAAVGNNVYAALLSSSGAILGVSNTITITNPMLGTFQEFTFATPINLTPATTYYLGFAQMTPPSLVAYYPAGTQASLYLPQNMYYSTTLTGGALTAITQNYGYFGMEAILAHTANVTVASTPSAICVGTCATLNALGSTSYTWNNVTPGPSITVCPTITTSYSVAASNTLGCTSSAFITLSVNPLPNVTASSNQTAICLGGTVSIMSSGASTYSWSSGATTATSVETPSITTSYTITGISAQGCSNTNTVDVIVNSFTPGITSSTAICSGEQITLSATGGTSNVWNTASPFASITVTPALTTGYTVTSVGANGCTGTNATTVTVNPNPTVTASAQRTVMCKGETNTLTANGATSYSWTNLASANASVVITGTSNLTFNYTVTGTNSTNCTHTAEVTVKVNLCVGVDEELQNVNGAVFPNPNSGLMTIRLTSFTSNATLEVFNSIGALVRTEAVNSDTVVLDLQKEPNGVYFIKINSEGLSNKTLKIIKH